MSSAISFVGGVVGATIGFFTGGPMGALYGAQIGMSIGSALDGGPAGPNLQGPRLSDLSGQMCSYGTPIARIKGKISDYGNVFWLKGNKLTEVETETENEGGKGGSDPGTTTTYAY